MSPSLATTQGQDFIFALGLGFFFFFLGVAVWLCVATTVHLLDRIGKC